MGIEKLHGVWFAIFTNPANIATRVRPDTWLNPTLGFKLDTLRLRKADLSNEYSGSKGRAGSSVSTEQAIAALESKA